MSSAVESLATALCPWLTPALQRFDAAREQGHLGHAWLISGPAGVGKINLALVLAYRLLGATNSVGTLEAAAALAALAGRHEPLDRHPDLHWLYPLEDKETISVEQVRETIEAFALTAHSGHGKVAIVEPADALTTAAANALLKTLEEPSPDSYLLLLSHRPQRLAATIRSRCQHVVVATPPPAAVAAWLDTSAEAVADAQLAVGAAPLRVAAALKESDSLFFNQLRNDLTQLSEDRLDPLAVATTWAKERPDLALNWLKRRLHEEIRHRNTASSSNEVTVPSPSALHNVWQGVPTRTLFDRYDKAEQLENLLGSGINVELAFQALLNVFPMNRGRS